VVEELSGIRINFHKSELIPMNVDLETVHSLTCLPVLLVTCLLGI
jgi:hypothetical protein